MELDLNIDLDLDLSLSPHSNKLSKLAFDFDRTRSCLDAAKKSRFDVVFREEFCVPNRRLSYLSGQPNKEDEDEDEDGDSLELNSSIVDDEEEISEIVGWPPIKSCMTKYRSYHHHHHPYHQFHPYHHRHQYQPYHHHGRKIMVMTTNKKSNHTAMIERVESSSSLSSSSSSSPTSKASMYVKVKMEGVAITRKVDMKRFSSYKSLTSSLITMFTKCCDINNTKYKFSYQGKEGDYLLLQEDIPWKKFIGCVHRIKIEKNGSCVYTKCLFER